jgi:signal peptidase I
MPHRARAGLVLVAMLSSLLTGCGVMGCHLYREPSGAMEPTIKKGAYLIVRNLPATAAIAAADLVVFRSPDDENALITKRVVGVGGQTIEMRRGRLYLDGHPVKEDYLPSACPPDDDIHLFKFQSMPELHDFGPVSLAAGDLFVMGDNRDHSRDSRSYGVVKRSAVVGSVVHVF